MGYMGYITDKELLLKRIGELERQLTESEDARQSLEKDTTRLLKKRLDELERQLADAKTLLTKVLLDRNAAADERDEAQRQLAAKEAELGRTAIALADAIERALTAERQLEHIVQIRLKNSNAWKRQAFEEAAPTIAYRPVFACGHVVGYSWQIVDYPPSPEVLAVDPQDRED